LPHPNLVKNKFDARTDYPLAENCFSQATALNLIILMNRYQFHGISRLDFER
jgi:hypothetical protein